MLNLFKKVIPHTHNRIRVLTKFGRMRPHKDNPYAESAYIYWMDYCKCGLYQIIFGHNMIEGKLPLEVMNEDPEIEKVQVYKYITQTMEEVRDDFMPDDYNLNYSI